MSPRPLVAQPLIDLAAALDGCDTAVLSVDCHGAAYAVGRRDGGALILRWEPGDPPDALQRLELRDEPARFDFVQPLPDGVLLAVARCRWRPEGAEANALALDWRGRAGARFTLGDGIQDLRVTPDGTVWVSYSDEGVFGNHGWNGPGPPPLGAAGLCAFTAAGEPRLAYRPDAAGTDVICDAYALNVSGDNDAWVYFYTEFPIVRIHDGRYHVWHTGVTGATALAIRGKRALLYGDYRRRDVLHLLELGAKGSATIVAERTLVGADGEALASAQVRGVGASLYLFHDRAISVVRDW